MKTTCILFLMLLCFTSCAQLDSILVDDMYRYYAVHLPPNYDGETELPVVLGFHGGFGSAEQFPEQSLMNETSDQEGFIAVYPDGLGYLLAPTLHFWNAGECCGYPFSEGIDDVAFIDQLIDHIGSQYAVDLNRVYATGISNGAMMSYRLACELSYKIAAIAPVAGPLMFHPCEPENPVPVIHFHSFEDSNIPFQGGVGDGASDHYNPPMDSVMNVWSQVNDCQIQADTIYEGADYTHVVWDDCLCSYRSEYYISTDGGHSWPGGVGTFIGDDPSEFVDANSLMWEFFEQFSLDCIVQGVGDLSSQTVDLFPNPSDGSLQLTGVQSALRLEILSTTGVLVMRHSPNGDRVELDVSHFPNGTYILRIFEPERIRTKRFVKL